MTVNIPPPPGNPRSFSSEVPSTSSALVQSLPLPPPPPPLDGRAIVVEALGSMPLLEGEDAIAYDRLRARVLAFVKPADILEEIWTGEFIDLEWDIHRYRRMKMYLMTVATREALVELLSPIEDQSYDLPREVKLEFTTTETLVRQWYWGSEDARKRINELLSSQPNLTMETVKARAFAKELPNIMRVEQLISNSEARRNATLREIERHREIFGRRLREASDNIQDAEYETIAPVEQPDRKN